MNRRAQPMHRVPIAATRSVPRWLVWVSRATLRSVDLSTVTSLDVDLSNPFWGTRQRQLRDHTLPVILDRLEESGALDAFRRLRPGAPPVERRGLWFSDSDLYKWMEAAAWSGRLDLLEGVIDLIDAAVHPDGYLHTFYDTGPGSHSRYGDLSTSHEWYCSGHFVEAALAHHIVTGESILVETAVRWADHVCDTFGPGRDERTDGHPEAELALARLARCLGKERFLTQAQWIVERQLSLAGLTIDTFELAGHAVKAVYLATGIAEIASATRSPRWLAAVERLVSSLIEQHSYPTGAVGSRWLDESVGKPYEMPDAMSYAESCAAVASVRFCQLAWELTGDPRTLDQIELLLFNAVPCGVGADGESWFYSQPHAVAEVASETNPWVLPFEYHQTNLIGWFPAHRQRWFDVACCPTNLARMYATVDHHIADIDESGNLRVQIPLAAHIRGSGWDVKVTSSYPDAGAIEVEVLQAPPQGKVLLREPGWAGGHGHRTLPLDGRVDLPISDEWWETDRRVESATHTVFLRRGPVVHCVEGHDAPGVDLRDLIVDPEQPAPTAFRQISGPEDRTLHSRALLSADTKPISGITTVPYHSWANREPTTMRIRFPRE